MAYGSKFIKRGMGGSRNGRSRTEHTEILKNESKKLRRDQGRAEALEGLADALDDDERGGGSTVGQQDSD